MSTIGARQIWEALDREATIRDWKLIAGTDGVVRVVTLSGEHIAALARPNALADAKLIVDLRNTLPERLAQYDHQQARIAQLEARIAELEGRIAQFEDEDEQFHQDMLGMYEPDAGDHLSDAEADGQVLASAGFGADEDYGDTGRED